MKKDLPIKTELLYISSVKFLLAQPLKNNIYIYVVTDSYSFNYS